MGIQIGELFPNCITETIDENGKPKKAINFDMLKQMLSDNVLEGDEAYEFTWVGKKAAIVESNKPIRKTLRPCKEESVDWDNTENLYIEGDNLEVLKLLQESYLNKVKMIYIDPPYNTGNDFIYRDDFAKSENEYLEEKGIYDLDGNKMYKNTDTNGRFHSDWCSMMYSRLMLARNLLTKDGVIFISLDDGEFDNLRKICNEVFGEKNFLECLIWKKRATPPNDRNIGRIHEFVLCYAKELENVSLGLLPRDEKSISRYSNPDNDSRGPWVASDLSANGKGGRIVQSCIYPIVNPQNGKEYFPSEGRCWLFNKEKMDAWIAEGRVSFRENTGAPFLKRYLSEVRQGLTLPTIMTEFGYSQTSAAEGDKLFGIKGVFEYAKPTTLINPLIRVGAPNDDDIIMDFFSGSSTTAHAVFQLNAELGSKKKFIMVQIPEKCNESSAAYKAGYRTICELARDRIKKAGIQIQNEKTDLFTKKELDIGFRVLKVDSSNMNDVYYAPSDYSQGFLNQLESNIKPDRTDLDLLFGCLLEWGLPLSLPYSSEEIDGCTVHDYNDGDLIACFDENVPDSVVKAIAKKKPLRAVFRDSSFSDSPSKINVGEIFKLLAPDTRVKVI
ncbi:site-specific DNA-methyltransferase [Catenibacterium mitsuokai]|uniref:site-specific DNA-methyltransferase n=1 Tax=Catenibacterium mitsuokai TaxID=100886 RepID=UPI00193111FB|nr:site-specific DNA-methyltransferase [Catenibacterium mitsuokai]